MPRARLFPPVLILAVLALIGAPMLAGAQVATPCAAPCDPGVRAGPAGAGGPINGITADQQSYFTEGKNRFLEVDSVSGTVSGEAGVGLGPRFNMNECGGCHAYPATGGSSPYTNPQIAAAHDAAAGCAASTSCNPANLGFTFLAGTPFQQPFISVNGPVREARFVRNPDGSPDGGVHDLFTITGRSDAVGCSITQPNFESAASSGNLVARIPTPVFGIGLIEAIRDVTIVENADSNESAKAALGISGHPNREGNAGTITRLGWKAQNKSASIFGGEAYLVEQGVTNELFPNERGEPGLDRPVASDGQRVEPPAACLFNGTPEDGENFDATSSTAAMSDVEGFAMFMAMLAPPAPAPLSASATTGEALFSQIGCAMCHTPSLPTRKSSIAPLSAQTANLYSDLLVHRMGSGLADGVSQGNAAGDEFRTAPLWGVGQRIFFLHDGRTKDLLQAIYAHASSGSEANAVINNFRALSPTNQQSVLDFLRSL
jgi:CxxC motif-containing protein (DUF1111 family)